MISEIIDKCIDTLEILDDTSLDCKEKAKEAVNNQKEAFKDDQIGRTSNAIPSRKAKERMLSSDLTIHEDG